MSDPFGITAMKLVTLLVLLDTKDATVYHIYYNNGSVNPTFGSTYLDCSANIDCFKG